MIARRALLSLAAVFVSAGVGGAMIGHASPAADAETTAPTPFHGAQIVAMHRLTEAQYRNSIADIFGPDVIPVGRFEPIVRSAHQLIASGATSASISPTGLEQFDIIARGVAAQVFDTRHRDTFVPCKPAKSDGADPACADLTLTAIGRFVLRRPLTASERSSYLSMADAAAQNAGSFTGGLELALSAMLVSPEFLYVIETAEPDPDHPGKLRLDNYSRAARLSYLLWNTTPDAALLDAAASGTLTNATQLRATAQRMVTSPRLEQGVRAFFADMLLFEKFDQLAKDPMIYPRFNPEVARALPEQLERTIVSHLLSERGDYRTLFTTPKTWMNRALGPVYFVPVKSRDGWEPYSFAPGDDRAGLLGQAGFLALYSHSGRSSPTLRGRAVREVLLCEPIPNPPGNVNFTVVQDTTNLNLRTARSRLSAHATDPSCSGCHRLTDPIGLSLEGFDGIGATRSSENGQKLDLAGQIDTSVFKGATGLGRALTADPALTQCAASRALEYAVGRPVDDQTDTVNELVKRFAANGYRFPDLMLQVATMPEAYRIKPDLLNTQPNLTRAPHHGSGASR